jgi:hypothetical protein
MKLTKGLPVSREDIQLVLDHDNLYDREGEEEKCKVRQWKQWLSDTHYFLTSFLGFGQNS